MVEQLLGKWVLFFKAIERSAALWIVATAIVTFRAQAQTDLAFGANYRSYPLAGFLEAEVGRGLLLYGSPGSPWNGYIRPRAIWSTAITYNSMDGAVEFFPLGILGVRAGGEAVENKTRFSAYDCKTHNCLGRFDRTYVETELTLGVGAVFARGRWRRERWSQRDPEAGDFIEPTAGLLMSQGGECQTVYTTFVGVNFGPSWGLVGISRYAEDDRDGFSRLWVGTLRYRTPQVVVSFGGGTFESSEKKLNPTAVFTVRWTVWPTVGLR